MPIPVSEGEGPPTRQPSLQNRSPLQPGSGALGEKKTTANRGTMDGKWQY